ncbi:hypothetical protein GQ53DRAFT_754023 [Thozetella sp. PMI_491]|nr:hypothetical protein GQ53DRAFT_754023 [Thozetella sp. PMI_491]
MNNKASLLALIITFMVASWICVCFRLVTRLFIIRSPGWDDLFVGLYLVTTTFFSISASIAPDWGLGRHLLSLKFSEFTNFLHTFYFMNAAYHTSAAFIKLALLLQFLRVFPKESRSRKACIALIVLVTGWGLAYGFISWFPCFPVADYWNNPLGDSCYGFGSGMVNDNTFVATFVSHAATNTLIDLLILALPIPLLFKQEITSRIRWGLSGLLTMGAVVTTFSIWRLATLVQHKAGMYPAQDPTWYAPISIALSALEIDLASICASIPVFWPVIEAQFGKIFITREIEITTEERWQITSSDESETELTGSRRNRRITIGSEGEINGLEKVHSGPGGRDGYYDEFLMGQIDPLRLQRKGSASHAEATIQAQASEKQEKRGGWWRL